MTAPSTVGSTLSNTDSNNKRQTALPEPSVKEDHLSNSIRTSSVPQFDCGNVTQAEAAEALTIGLLSLHIQAPPKQTFSPISRDSSLAQIQFKPIVAKGNIATHMNPPTTAIGAKYPLGTPATAVLASLDPTRTNTGKPNTPPTNGSSNLAASTKAASTKNDFLHSTASDWFDGDAESGSSSATHVAPGFSITKKLSSLSRTSTNPSIKSNDADRGRSQTVPAPNTPSLNRSPTRSPSPQKTMKEAPVQTMPVMFQKKSLNDPQTSPSRTQEEWIVLHQEQMSADEQTAAEINRINTNIARMDRFKAVLQQPNVDLDRLRKLSWSGVPDELRSLTWQLLMGYLPCNSERRDQALVKKRKDYEEYVQQSYAKGQAGLDHAIWHQIHIDVPRTNPGIKLYQHSRIQESLERILYCWAIRHPASGYVQGINDLATPFYQVFLSTNVGTDEVGNFDVENVPDDVLSVVEADCFWCLSKLLDGIQDNYTHAQPGIHRQIQKMKELIGRIDAQLYSHLQTQGIDFIQFAFRWINCLLMRELSIRSVMRMWDTYLSEGPDGFSDFHSYVCAAFLAKWSTHIQKLEFQDIMMFLQNLPTKDWTEKDIELLLSEAYMWKSLFGSSPSHLANSASASNNCCDETNADCFLGDQGLRGMSMMKFPLAIASFLILFQIRVSSAADRLVREKTFIVRLKESTTVSTTESLLSKIEDRLHGKIKYRYTLSFFNGFSFTISKATPYTLIQKYVLSHKDVVHIEEDQICRASDLKVQRNAPWNLARLTQRITKSNEYIYDSTSGYGTDIYIMDTGVYLEHSEFRGRAMFGANFNGQKPDKGDFNGHGTHVAGIAAGHFLGVAKNATIIDVRVLSSSGEGKWSDVMAGLEWSLRFFELRKRPAIINISINGPKSLALNNMITGLISQGIHMVVAAGNVHTDACEASPSSAPNATTVGSIGQGDYVSDFSNIGRCIALFAPGEQILSASTETPYSTAWRSGTSMSAPHVSGVKALLLAHNRDQTPYELQMQLYRRSSQNILNHVPQNTPNRLLYLDPTLSL